MDPYFRLFKLVNREISKLDGFTKVELLSVGDCLDRSSIQRNSDFALCKVRMRYNKRELANFARLSSIVGAIGIHLNSGHMTTLYRHPNSSPHIGLCV